MVSTQQSKANIQRLITLERAQKLDLLIHLISNLSQSLIICGPEGVGKTTILDAMVENKKDSWPIIMLSGTSGLSFESILDQFTQKFLQLQPEYAGQNLPSILESYNKHNQKVVFVIDDAGMLVPGLISALIEYAQTNNGLRLVFSLTHDELHIKNSSDRFIEECHLIEIPPITKKQYTTYLQNLSAQPGAAISFNAINEGLIDNLYRQTYGIPGKIVTELPRLASYKPTTGFRWGFGAVIALAITFIIGSLYFNKPESQVVKSQLVEPLIEKKIVAVEISSPVIQSANNERIDSDVEFNNKQVINTYENVVVQVEKEKKEVLANEEIEEIPSEDKILAEAEAEPLLSKKETVEKIEPVKVSAASVEVKRKADKQEVDITEKQVAVEKAKESISVPKAEKEAADDVLWVRSQASENYTMQLMVLSKKQSVAELLKKYQAYKKSLKYFQVNKKDQEKFVVIYGSYKTSADAAKAKKKLPSELRKAWIRKFKVLHQQIKEN